jgi:hypothetical protein
MRLCHALKALPGVCHTQKNLIPFPLALANRLNSRYPMATLSSTHEHQTTLSSTVPCKDAELGQPPRRVKGVKVVPMYHPRMGYLHILAYAACNLVSPLPTEGSAISCDSEAHSVATPSPPTNWVPLPPIFKHMEMSPSTHGSLPEPSGVRAPVSTLTALNARRLRSHDLRPPARTTHPYKDLSYSEFRHSGVFGPNRSRWFCSPALCKENQVRRRYFSNQILK